MIRRYYATKDNTITNAFEDNLTTRGTGSNMGASDILETFSIYGQGSSSSGLSSELARTLIEFNITEISSSRQTGTIPASGSVSFYLKMYNAPHSQTVPSSFTLDVQGVSGSWQEGYGIDMDFYEDLTNDGFGSNWINASDNFVSASATITALSKTSGQANARILTVEDSDGNSVDFAIDNSTSTSTATKIAFANANSNANQFATNIAAAINAADTANTLNVSATSDNATVTLTQNAKGAAGNSAAALAGTAIDDSVVTIVNHFAGGTGQWATQGGDFYTDSSSSFTQTFSTGLEDLCVDVTTLVEQWINTQNNVLGSKNNNGFVVKLTNAHETESKSFFTKKFFGRDSEFFFQRPVLEARWDSARRDDRGSFYAKSDLASAEDNLNTLFLYNRIRGRLRDIPAVGTNNIQVSLYDSVGGPQVGGYNVFTGTHVSTGVYSCNVTASTTGSSIVDVWHYSGEQYFTGSIEVKTFNSDGYNPEDTYVLSMPNLRKEYRKDQTHRLNLYVRERNWSPNIHTLAVRSSIPSLVIPSGSFQLRRCIDDYIVVPYGTGSATDTAYTTLSHDVSGNYFDLDTTYLEAGYLYDIQYSFYDEENGWEEQPYRFKFRVVD
tara:strand:- start:1323 stop:3152 length:1830 start_codon:yes stop_codon:yes gene_type:complete